MVPSVLSSTHEAVLKAVAQSAAGANIEQIEAQLPQPPTRRTLQRWLNALVGQGRLRKEGQARSTRYLLPVQAALTSAAAFAAGAALPLVVAAVAPASSLLYWVAGTALVFLALLGGVACVLTWRKIAP